jgi:hypothetical protein
VHEGDAVNGTGYTAYGFFHIDPATLDGGGRLLLWGMMHESAHAVGGDTHVGQTSEPYTSVPFNYISSTWGPNTCIK